MKISQLARRAHVGCETIRYYQRRGLLETPPRSTGAGCRDYSESDLQRLHFIRYLKRLGFTLSEIGDALGPWTRGQVSPVDKAATLRRKLDELRARRREIDEIEFALQAELACCEGESLTSRRELAHRGSRAPS